MVLKLPPVDTRDPRSAFAGLRQRIRSNDSVDREAVAAALTSPPLGRTDPTDVAISGVHPSDDRTTTFSS